MTTKKEKLALVIDGEGAVEVTGIAHGDIEAHRLAKELGLGAIEPLNFMFTAIKAGPLDPGVRASVLDKAREMGMEVETVDLLPFAPAARKADPTAPAADSTIEVLHQHSLTPSRREKAIYPLIVLAVLALLFTVGMVIRDHMNHDYRAVPNLAEALRLVEEPRSEPGFPTSLFNPGDAAYVAVAVKGWDYWSGPHAITQGYFVQMPDLQVPIEQMVKGERGAATLVFRFDLSRSTTGNLFVEQIWRGGMASEFEDQSMLLSPVTLGDPPPSSTTGAEGTYAFDTDIAYEVTRSFDRLTGFVAVGFVLETADGFELATDKYRLALAPEFSPAVRTILADLALGEDDRALFENPEIPIKQKTALYTKRTRLYVTMGNVYPWTESGKPGRRQSTKQIGEARLDGIQLGKVFVINGEGMAARAQS